MITEDYISFETAKLLKEKGFNEDIDLWYDENGEMFSHYKYDISCDWRVKAQLKVYLCPTLQMAIKWLREVHHYYIQVMLDSWALGSHLGYYVVIQKTDSNFEMMLQDAVDEVFYQTYEEACEAAIKHCLTKLI